MTTRKPWGHQSRHCIACGKVGPRVVVVGGYAHRRCITKSKRKVRRPALPAPPAQEGR